MHSNSADIKIHPNPTMATFIFRPSKIQGQDGRQNAQKYEIDLYLSPKISFQLKFITLTNNKVFWRLQTMRTSNKAEMIEKNVLFCIYFS